jgi:hypothetical protein
MLTKYENEPFLLYYEARYMLGMMVTKDALTLVNSIVRYNQFEVWCLAAEIHL